jgi:hypothetical protein
MLNQINNLSDKENVEALQTFALARVSRSEGRKKNLLV